MRRLRFTEAEKYLIGQLSDATAKVAELESDLASERAKRVEAEAESYVHEGVANMNRDRALAAEAIIEQALSTLREGQWVQEFHDPAWSKWAKGIADALEIDTSALPRHDAEVAAKAWEEAADEVRPVVIQWEDHGGNIEHMLKDWLRDRAAEKRAAAAPPTGNPSAQRSTTGGEL